MVHFVFGENDNYLLDVFASCNYSLNLYKEIIIWFYFGFLLLVYGMLIVYTFCPIWQSFSTVAKHCEQTNEMLTSYLQNYNNLCCTRKE